MLQLIKSRWKIQDSVFNNLKYRAYISLFCSGAGISGTDVKNEWRLTAGNISELVTMKLRKQIDDETYSREYQRLNRQLTELKIQKDELDRTSLQRSKDASKMTAVKDIIGDGTQPLTEFEEDIFYAMVKKVVVKSKTEFEFWFESGEILKVKSANW